MAKGRFQRTQDAIRLERRLLEHSYDVHKNDKPFSIYRKISGEAWLLRLNQYSDIALIGFLVTMFYHFLAISKSHKQYMLTLDDIALMMF